MIRKIKLYGMLATAAGTQQLTFDVDTQPKLFAYLRGYTPALSMALRAQPVALFSTTARGKKAEAIEPGFSFASKAKVLHIAPIIEGAAIPLIVEEIIVAIIVAVAVAAISTLLISHMSGSNNSTGAKSTMFNGVINSTDQGGAIPIVYGKKVLIGSTVIAADETYVNLV